MSENEEDIDFAVKPNTPKKPPPAAPTPVNEVVVVKFDTPKKSPALLAKELAVILDSSSPRVVCESLCSPQLERVRSTTDENESVQKSSATMGKKKKRKSKYVVPKNWKSPKEHARLLNQSSVRDFNNTTYNFRENVTGVLSRNMSSFLELPTPIKKRKPTTSEKGVRYKSENPLKDSRPAGPTRRMPRKSMLPEPKLESVQEVSSDGTPAYSKLDTGKY